MRDIELLAPARNAQIGIAAIDCGADAVYIAGPAFGARKDAANSIEDIERLCKYAARFGVRVYVTFNILLLDSELETVHGQMLACQKAGASAFIIRDPRLCLFPDIHLPMHASTQCAIRDVERARLFLDAGCSRIVLERELPPSKIKEISSTLPCEIECFVHGALCVCYSGQCTLSSALTASNTGITANNFGCSASKYATCSNESLTNENHKNIGLELEFTGRSADRGECVQACRNLYDLVDESGRVLLKDKALLSLKDLNLYEHIEELLECGVCSLKIEGRLKNETYVRNVVKAYSDKLNQIIAANPNLYRRASFGRIHGGFTPSLAKIFNRSYTSLFFEQKVSSWANFTAPKSMGEPLAVVESIVSINKGNNVEIRLAPIQNRHERGMRADEDLCLCNGDGFAFVNGKEIVGFRGDVCKGRSIICKAPKSLKVGILLYRNYSAAFEKQIEQNPCKRLIDVRVDYELLDYNAGPKNIDNNRSNEDGVYSFEMSLRAYAEDGRSVKVVRKYKTLEVEVANNQEREFSIYKSQLEKEASIYAFSLESCRGPLLHLSFSALNEIRRELAQRLDVQGCKARSILSYKEMVAKGPDTISSDSCHDRFVSMNAMSTGRKESELMRTKYCLRAELGVCPKNKKTSPCSHSSYAVTNDAILSQISKARQLYLQNNGRRFPLRFDCENCEMVVLLPFV